AGHERASETARFGHPAWSWDSQRESRGRGSARSTRHNIRRRPARMPDQSRVLPYPGGRESAGARQNDRCLLQTTFGRIEGLAGGEGCPWRRFDACCRAENLRQRNREATSRARIHSQLHARNRLAPAAAVHHHGKTNRQVRPRLTADSGSAASMSEAKLLSRRIAYKGSHIQVREDRVIEPAGYECSREIVVHPGAVCIVARPSPEEVILIRQYRHATGQELLEIPAGTLHEGEDPLECALRELEEETGYRATTMTERA